MGNKFTYRTVRLNDLDDEEFMQLANIRREAFSIETKSQTTRKEITSRIQGLGVNNWILAMFRNEVVGIVAYTDLVSKDGYHYTFMFCLCLKK